MSVLVVDGKGPNLMGRDRLAKVKVMPQVHSLSDHTPLREVLSQHASFCLSTGVPRLCAGFGTSSSSASLAYS